MPKFVKTYVRLWKTTTEIFEMLIDLSGKYVTTNTVFNLGSP